MGGWVQPSRPQYCMEGVRNMPRVGASSKGAELTRKDNERLRKGMNKSSSSEKKRAHMQPDMASGRRDAAPYQHGQIAPPPPEADFSNKGRSVQGKQKAKQAAPVKAASQPRKDVTKKVVKPAGVGSVKGSTVKKAQSLTEKNKSFSDEALAGRSTGKASGAKRPTSKNTQGRSAAGMKRSPR